ncbi:hypothetical protein BDW02DRAFT_20903 [Decorospora gaudefroyi]|uniref:Uncharacterized protein n=1 Tax=Decorospora gaudefroyi TaxID=184978 RepID=A0A6A5KFM4_9PLEO|nr:hypothetical protein BDW02DRAFT_20903 [Decorospora gaudefroyi]
MSPTLHTPHIYPSSSISRHRTPSRLLAHHVYPRPNETIYSRSCHHHLLLSILLFWLYCTIPLPLFLAFCIIGTTYGHERSGRSASHLYRYHIASMFGREDGFVFTMDEVFVGINTVLFGEALRERVFFIRYALSRLNRLRNDDDHDS